MRSWQIKWLTMMTVAGCMGCGGEATNNGTPDIGAFDASAVDTSTGDARAVDTGTLDTAVDTAIAVCPPGSNGVVCRPAAGPCDVAEVCTAGVCPPDAFVMATAQQVCRAAVGACDEPDHCDGASAGCPSDAAKASGTVCRVATGACDQAEQCDGIALACPIDAAQAAGVECRASAGACDSPEQCDGSTAVCPADTMRPATFECRPSGGPCDVAEQCDGVMDACPRDQFRPSSATCGSYFCSGAAATCPATCTTTIGQCVPGFACSAATCLAAKTAFITSTTHTGNLGGVAGANQICQNRATAAGLTGTYRAWLSTLQPAVSPSTTFTRHSGPYVTTTRVVIADSWADLTDNTLDVPLDVTENRTPASTSNPIAWSSCNANGTNYFFVAARDCSNWTSAVNGGGSYPNLGYSGSWGYSTSAWSLNSDFGCATQARLYCFEQ